MFLEYYGLREQPFGVTPDPRFLYFGPTHREALASLFYGIESGCGFLTLIAQPGMGKTTLLFHLLEKLRSSAQTIFLFQTQCGSREMFRHLLNDLGIDSGEQDLASMHESLNAVLLSNARKGRRVVLVIDEAQNLKNSVLETVRLLSDFETPQAKLLQIVLSGQPQLADKLAHPALTQLRQRVSVISRLHPFTRVETMVYIEYRLSKAGYSGAPLFSYAAADMIAANSNGTPRTINNLCFNAMTLGFAKRQRQIDVATVCEVLADLDLDGLSTHRSAAPVADETLSSFDGISPSNDLSYQDFHDAVRAAWGNGAPIKIEDRPEQEIAVRKAPERSTRAADEIFQMHLDAEEASATSLQLDEELAEEGEEEEEEDDANFVSSLRASAASPLPTGKQASHAEAYLEDEIEQTDEPFETKEMQNQDNTAPRPAQGSPNITLMRTGMALQAAWRSLARTFHAAFKKASASGGKRRTIRGGTAVAIGFGLALSGGAFARHRLESPKPPAGIVAVAPEPDSVELSQPTEVPPGIQTSEMPAAKPVYRSADAQGGSTVTLEDGQTIGDVSLRYFGQFSPMFIKKILDLNPEISDPNMIAAGTQIRVPAVSAGTDVKAAQEIPNQAKELQ